MPVWFLIVLLPGRGSGRALGRAHGPEGVPQAGRTPPSSGAPRRQSAKTQLWSRGTDLRAGGRHDHSGRKAVPYLGSIIGPAREGTRQRRVATTSGVCVAFTRTIRHRRWAAGRARECNRERAGSGRRALGRTSGLALKQMLAGHAALVPASSRNGTCARASSRYAKGIRRRHGRGDRRRRPLPFPSSPVEGCSRGSRRPHYSRRRAVEASKTARCRDAVGVEWMKTRHVSHRVGRRRSGVGV